MSFSAILLLLLFHFSFASYPFFSLAYIYIYVCVYCCLFFVKNNLFVLKFECKSIKIKVDWYLFVLFAFDSRSIYRRVILLSRLEFEFCLCLRKIHLFSFPDENKVWHWENKNCLSYARSSLFFIWLQK